MVEQFDLSSALPDDIFVGRRNQKACRHPPVEGTDNFHDMIGRLAIKIACQFISVDLGCRFKSARIGGREMVLSGLTTCPGVMDHS